MGNQSIGDILEYFDNDSTRFTVFLSRFLDKNYSLYYTPTEEEKAREAEKEKAIALANTEEKEDEETGNKVELEEAPEKEKSWKHLPYIPVQGDEYDELLAEQLNIYEIDINIRPIQLKKKKKKKRGKSKKEDNRVFYRIAGKKKRVKLIHGALLVRENKKWTPLIPYLRKLAGLPAMD